MNRVLSILISCMLGSVVVLGGYGLGRASADTPTTLADAGAQLDAGSASATPAPTPADQLHNPAADPLAAWNDVKLARKTSWPLAVWAGLAMFGKLLAYGKDKLSTVPLLGRLAAWLSVGRRAMAVAAIGAIGTAGFNVLIAGGTTVAALIASGVAIAGVTHSTTQSQSSSS